MAGAPSIPRDPFAGVFEAIAHDLRIVQRLLKKCREDPTATILDAHALLGEDGAALGERLASVSSVPVEEALAGPARQVERPADAVGGDRGGGVLRLEGVRLDSPGGAEGMLVLRDVTELAKASAALRDSRDRLKARVAERTAELSQRAHQLARLASELTLAEQRERRRLAVVLHDHLQQMLVGSKFELGAALPDLPAESRPQFESVIATLDEAVRVSQSLTVDLCPPILHDAGLAAGLGWLGRQMKDRHGLTVKVRADEAADPGRADVRSLLFQAARELLFNTVKHAGVEEAAVTLAVGGSGRLRLTVSDLGRGCDPRTVMGIPDASGGFGLFSVRERLTLLGGSMTVRSEPGAGAAFTLTAPLGADPDDPTLLDAAPDAETGRDDGDGPVRVLLADDHSVVRRDLSLMLAAADGLEVVGEATDGADAVERAKELKPDVVLMDFSMPRLNGVEATRRVTAEVPGTKVIGLSMYEESDRATPRPPPGRPPTSPRAPTPQSSPRASVKSPPVASRREDRRGGLVADS